jgi:hypothetical protein
MLAKIGTRNKKIHSNELYHQILLDLVTTNKTYEEISKIYGVNKSIIAGISSGYKHTYLRDEYPELYTKLIKILGSRKQGNYKAVEYTVVSPELISYTFTNISEFARQNNLDIGSLNRLVHKKAKSHKGWKLQDA